MEGTTVTVDERTQCFLTCFFLWSPKVIFREFATSSLKLCLTGGNFWCVRKNGKAKNNKKKTFKTSSRRSEANFKQIHSSSTRDEKSCRLWQSSSKKRKRFIICSASWQWKLNNFRLFSSHLSSSSSFSGFLSRCRMHGIFKVSRVLESYKFYGLFHSFHLC